MDIIDKTITPDPYDPKPGDVYATADEATIFARVYESARILVSDGETKRPETVQEFLGRLQGESPRRTESRSMFDRGQHRVPRRIVVYDFYATPNSDERNFVRACVRRRLRPPVHDHALGLANLARQHP